MNIGILLAALGLGAVALSLKKPAVFRDSLHVYGNGVLDATFLSKALQRWSMLLVDNRIMGKDKYGRIRYPGKKEAERLTTQATRPRILIALAPSFDSWKDPDLELLEPFLEFALAVHRADRIFPYMTFLVAPTGPFAQNVKTMVDEMNSRVGQPYRNRLQWVQVARDEKGAFMLTPQDVAQIAYSG